MSRKVVLLTNHYLNSARKAGYHWLAKAFHRQGWDTTFATVSFSPLTSLAGDFRAKLIASQEFNRRVMVEPKLSSVVWRTPFHPVHLRNDFLNTVASKLFEAYGSLPLKALREPLAQADLVIFESCAALLLVDRVRKLNPRARLVYRMSDDLRLLRGHPVVYQAEQKYLPLFDLVSVPSDYMRRSMKNYGRITCHSHGVEKDLFAQNSVSPYAACSKNAVFVGTNHFDVNCVNVAAEAFPEWHFHVIGPVPPPIARANVHVYGEMPFAQTVPYIKHADIGLGTLRYLPNAESFSNSLKILQYTHVGLPILAPNFLVNDLGNLVPYIAGDGASIIQAFKNAIDFDRTQIRRDRVSSWDELAHLLAADSPS